jgi:hemerythrin superfamily protein
MANHEHAIDARATLITLMLREDHQKLKELFAQFGTTTNNTEKRNIVTAAIAALEVHAKIEEELIYPAWQEHVDEQGLTDEALAEHHVVHLLIKELKEINPEDATYNAKFSVLHEHVTHHIEEEEGKMFPQAEKADVDWDRLTKQVKNPAFPGGAFVNQEGMCLRFATGCHSSPLFRAGHPGRSW